MLKKHFKQIMNANRCPERLWDYKIRQVAEIQQVIPRGLSKERTPMEYITVLRQS